MFMRVGIDSYSYHRYFGEIYPFQKDPGRRWTATDFAARAAALKVDGVSLELLDGHGLDRVLAWGHPDGLEGGRNSEALQDLTKHISIARALGARVMRIVGSSLRFRHEPSGPQIERLSRMLREAVQVAETHGIVLAIESHIDSLPGKSSN
jgi:sugar phosphate isomerase/epimerase